MIFTLVPVVPLQLIACDILPWASSPVSSIAVILGFFYPNFPYDFILPSHIGLQTLTKLSIAFYFWRMVVDFSTDAAGYCCLFVIDVC